jgi:hypothetical protein
MKHTHEQMQQVAPILRQHKGNLPVYVSVNTVDGKLVTLKLPSDLSIKPSHEVAGDLERLLGSGAVQFHGAGSKRQKKLAQQQLFKEGIAEAAPEVPVPAGDEEAAAALDAEEQAAEVAA